MRLTYEIPFDALLDAGYAHGDGGEPSPLAETARRFEGYCLKGQYVLAASARPESRFVAAGGLDPGNHLLTGRFLLDLDMEREPDDETEWAEWLEDSFCMAMPRSICEGREAIATRMPRRI